MPNYADEMRQLFDRWHAHDPEVNDPALDALIHRQYAEILERHDEREGRFDYSIPFFRPSSANSDPRELYLSIRGAEGDIQKKQPHQGRWTRMGTATGTTLQRDLLFIEKHYEAIFGEAPPFVPERTKEGYPAWEEFARWQRIIRHNGQDFSILGSPDGIIRHIDGTRMGFEVKSKQTTPARTSEYSMRAPEDKHFWQCVAYSILFGLDRYLIVYMNLAKQKWSMTPEEFKKTPDLRIFEIVVTDDHKRELLDTFADIVHRAKANDPPMLDLSRWTFNNYKHACAESLSDDEFIELRAQVKESLKSPKLRDYEKDAYYAAYEFIADVRRGVRADGS
jgi:hypothetical protein